ncbi:lipocalin-like protein [Flavobacterium lacus]|uniref:Lipocalin-like protein n=2 Tax=Flavobacterium lacus TaxID=1353778 RepID=A0A328WR57_9FLAO|nr:lipocalin-like protein [Flavobacterium lacus]
MELKRRWRRQLILLNKKFRITEMKKFTLFLVFAGLTISCNTSDDEGSAISEPTILGKWYIKGGTSNGGEFQNYNHDCETSRDFQEFFTNGELTFNGHNTSCELNEVELAAWILNGSILTISSSPFDPMLYEYTYIVESLTNDELILKQTVNDPEGIIVYRSTFTRN